MKKLYVGQEFQYRSNGKDYYKIYVERAATGAMVRGSRTLRSFTGSTLKRKRAELQQEIDRGGWDR